MDKSLTPQAAARSAPVAPLQQPAQQPGKGKGRGRTRQQPTPPVEHVLGHMAPSVRHSADRPLVDHHLVCPHSLSRGLIAAAFSGKIFLLKKRGAGGFSARVPLFVYLSGWQRPRLGQSPQPQLQPPRWCLLFQIPRPTMAATIAKTISAPTMVGPFKKSSPFSSRRR